MLAQAAYTLAKPVQLAGVGVHTGQECLIRLIPRKTPGIELTVNGSPLTLGPTFMRPTPLCTLLQSEDKKTTLSTPEHLLAALHGLNIFGLKIEAEGPVGQVEVPILDGSALPWVAAIDTVGREPLSRLPEPLKVQQPVSHFAEGRVLQAEPRLMGGLQVECTIEFPHPAIGRQTLNVVVTEEVFRSQIAPARSFAMEADVHAAMKAGMLKGASLKGGVLFGANGQVVNPEGLRFPDEPVRHKILDFIGDSFLCARPVQGRFTLTAPGHTANNALLRQLVAQEA